MLTHFQLGNLDEAVEPFAQCVTRPSPLVNALTSPPSQIDQENRTLRQTTLHDPNRLSVFHYMYVALGHTTDSCSTST